MRTPLLIAVATLISVASYPALAQGMDQMGTGRGGTSAEGAPGMMHTRRRVPHPSVLGPQEAGSIQRRTQTDQRNDTITKGICIGRSR